MKPTYRILRVGSPRVTPCKVYTLKEAEAEALRLAGVEPGETFEIYQCLGLARTSVPSVFWNDGCEPAAPEPHAVERYPTTPLPEGFDRWECRGFGWKPGRKVTYTIAYLPGDFWGSAMADRIPDGHQNYEYWEAVKAEPGYRMLEAGERIEEGDEFLVAGSDNGWLKHQVNIERPWYPEIYYATRRPINNSKP
jgi:hypothetical protein